MAIRNSHSRRSHRSLLSRRALRARSGPRTLNLEPFEERTLFAVGLVAAYSSENVVLAPDQILHTAPTELTFRFNSTIDPASLVGAGGANLRVTRGSDHILGNGNDINVNVPYVGMTATPTDVVLRFANPLPDDLYQFEIVGAGATPLKSKAGEAFNGGQNLTRQFTLDLGAQVVAIVPQPVTRNDATNGLSQASSQIDVYFNSNDPLDPTTATNRTFYQLIRTAGTASTTDDARFNPASVTYDAAAGKAVLTFDAGVLSVAGLYRLRIGNNDPLPFAPATPIIGSPGTTFSSAADLGTIFPAAQGTQTVNAAGTITGVPLDVLFPGGPDDPGSRDIPIESHLNGSPNTSGNIPIVPYNFKNNIGSVLGVPAFNSITEAQKQRVREVLSYYSQYLGVEFYETPSSGITIATGDPRVVSPNVPPGGVGGIAGGGLAVMNAGVDWGASEAGGGYFQTAMHEIGHVLGLGHTYELPPLTIQGSGEAITDAPTAEGVFPGDADVVLGQYLLPPIGNDIDVYKFTLARPGTLNLETFAERLRDFDPSVDPSQLNAVITVFDSAGNVLARNDDYYGADAFLQLAVGSGTYYVAVTSTGNTNFDPNVPNSGFGGTTQGAYRLRLTFSPTATVGIKDATGTLLDGDGDGAPGGVNNFWFRVASPAQTIFVDKAASTGTGALGSITNPYKSISLAMAAASAGSVVRIVGNGGADKDLATLGDNQSYNIGFDNIGGQLSDGARFEVPKDVTVMIDAGAILKFRSANIDVGTVAQGINHSGGALQVLGTTARNAQGADVGSVYLTSYYNSTIGTDSGTSKDPSPTAGNWGGLVFREDSDLEDRGIFLNYVNRAKISYGGGEVIVNSVPQTFDPIHLVMSRPTVSFNTITNSANAAVSADPNSFQESQFQSPSFAADYTRSGPKVYRNALLNNSINGLFVRVRTDTDTGAVIDRMSVSGRFSTTDMVYVIEENLEIAGNPGGFIQLNGQLTARPSGRLAIDPGVIVKMGGSRIETEIGSQFIAEGTAARPIIFTSIFDDRYGAGGVFDTTNDQADTSPAEGDWAGLYFGPLSIASLDHTLITFAGGRWAIEGGFGTFNAVEIHQAQVRMANSTLEHNGPGGDTSGRAGRGTTTPAIIFVRGAQPLLLNNIIQNNDTAPTELNEPLRQTAAISINVNALKATLVTDYGRSTGLADVLVRTLTNSGPLVQGNRIGNTPVNGMIVRGGRLTTDVVWDDTDIVHVVLDEVQADTQFALSGRLLLESSATESLIIKLLGTTAGITASGVPLDINDRTGGAVQMIGMANHPIIMTSLFDTTVGAGFAPDGTPQNDTHNILGSSSQPTLSTNSGPVVIDGGDRDDHGFFDDDADENRDGWKFLEQSVNFAYSQSLNTAGTGVLVIGIDNDAQDDTRAEDAIESVADVLNLDLTYLFGADIASRDTASFRQFLSQFRMIYVPSDAFNTEGGITDADLDRLAARKFDIQNYVNTLGGGLVALTEDFAQNPYSWLELPQPFTIQTGFGVDLVQTPLLAAAGFNITDEELSAGTPWHNTFIGPPGYNRLQVWVVDPVSGQPVTLGIGAGQGGIGVRLADPQPGDWRSIKLDDFSNDRNVDILNEFEQRFAPTGDTNGLPTTAQFIGELAKDQKSGDDNRRLGFEIHGTISQTATGPKGGDVDVYSFRGTAGSVVWFDIDRTAQSLDTVVELIDANGAVVARSDNSNVEQNDPALLVGIAQPMRAGFVNNPGPFTNPDHYSTNGKDAGMRLVLPGTANSVNTYFVRVRASSSNLNQLNNGGSQGEYVLQIRLQNLDEFPGSTVRYADIRYAAIGIEVIGKPGQSPLLGDTASSNLPHNTFETAQDLGNLLTTDRNEITVAGNLANANDVVWFKMDLNYDLIQSIGGFSNGLKSFATMFNISYADGLTRPDTTISIFDQIGNLLLIGRDSQIPDTQPRETLGSDTTNTSHGSFGALDATVGSVQMPAGGPQPGTGPTPIGGTAGRTYYIAVSSSAQLPTVLDATFQMEATNPRVRLEPINSTKRLVDDRIGSTGDTTAAGSQQIFTGNSPVELNVAAVPYTLNDVVLYANTVTDLLTINPFTGKVQTFITDPFFTSSPGADPQEYFASASPGSDVGYFDIAMRDDGRLYTYRVGFGDNNTADTNGGYTQADPGDARTIDLREFAIETFVVSPDNPVNQDGTWAFVAPDEDAGVAFNAMTITRSTDVFNPLTDGRTSRFLYAVGNRNPGGTIQFNGQTVAPITEFQNLLFRLDPDTGLPFDTDLITNEDAFPRPDDVTFIAWQPYAQGSPSPLYPTDILAGSGTVVVPRGTLRTGVFLVTVDATNTDPAALFATSVEGVPIDDLDLNDDETIEVSGVPVTFEGGWELRLRNANAATLIPDGLTFDISGRRFEMDSNGVFNGANVRVQFNASDSVDALLEKMTVAVNGAAISNLGQTVVASHARDRILFLNPANNTTNLTQFTNLSPTFTVSGRTGAAGVVVKFLATDTADDLASKIASAITNGIPDVNPNNPGTPITVPNWGINITATNLGNGIVQLNAGVFDAETGSLDSPFESDAPEVVNLGQFFDAVGDITGVAVLPQPSDVFFFDELMYTVSDTGGLYRVNNYFSDDRASLELLSLVHDPDGERAHFTGLTQGPGTVENGRYAQTLFAVDEKGNLYAFDSEGRPANIFVNGASVVSSGFGSQLTFGSIQGLAFSPLDYNLWHTTSTRGGDADRGEHGVNSSFDYDAARGVTTNGGNSFYFGLEDPRTIGGDYRQQPSTWAYIPFADQPLLSGNQALFGSYNLPGGAKGSLISGEFSLEGYAATDKPTLYFNYALDSEGANSKQSGMLDSFRVYASSDGVNWTPLATNNSVKSATFSTDAELPTYLSQSGGEYQNDKSNQRVQELFDPPGEEDETPNYPTNPFDEPLPTTAVEWRQARVDLGDLAGQSNIRLRFDFSTAGTMGTGNLLQGGVYLGAVAARDIKDGDQFTLDRTSEKPGTTFTFREGLSLVVPAGGGSVIGEGETFTVGTRTFEFTRDANVTGANVPVLITSAQTPQEVADSIFAAIVGSPIAGVTPVRDSGYSLQVSINGSVDLVNGETLTVNGRTFELRRAGDFGEPNIAVAYDSTLILEAPATGGFDLVNGETFTINDTTFELRSSGVFTPGNVPIQFNQLDSRVTVSTKIITAINNANIPNVDAVQFGTGIALLGATSATRSTLQSLRLFAEPDFGTTPADDVVALIRDAIAFADLGVSSVQTGNNLQLVGADSVTQSVAHSLLLALQTDGVRVQLLGATGVTQSSGASLIVEGSALGTLTNTDIFYQVNWTAEQVAQAVAIALDAALTINGGQDNPDVFTSSKRDGDRLQLFGHFVNDSGPLTTSNFLQGDQYGVYDAAYNPATGSYNMAARARGQNNEHQGVFIDDIIVGFAARGEMVTGHFDPTTRLFDDTIPVEPGVNTFTPAPTNPDFTDPQRVLAGPFQLNIRRGTEYGASSSGNTPFISLFQTFDVNDRLAQGLSLIVPAAAQLVDGQTFAITLVDGRTLTFEFDSNNALTNPNNFPVLIQEGDLATTVALRVRDAINNVPASFKFDVKASVKPEKDRVDVFGGVHIEAGPLTLLIFDNLGDATPIRTQGETIVANNRISNVQQAGIIVRPVLSASGESFSVGVPGRTASVINLPVLNGKGYVPGVAIKENLIVKGGQTGIVFSGSPTTDIAHSVPFGRILNNTIVQTPFGIQVVNNASPTLLNNVVAETGTAIRIDNSSASTVLGASVYQNNTTNLAAPGGFLQTDPIVLQPTAPLFVDSSKSNFYLQAASRAIDSSVNTLQDRPELTAVTNPLGIPASPIQASERDLLGQLRVDDVTVPSPPGLGSNVFKDRGALERADVLGPAARLLNPLDNDAGLIDKSQTVNKVIVVGRKLSNFEIQLVDAGVGVDDATVTAEKFVITRTVGGVTTTLVPDVDYSIDYQTTADIVLVTPTEGVWSNAIYNITLNNGTGGIADSLGNKLQPNETGGGTRFTIELTDTLTSPWQNPVNKFDVNGDGNIYPLDAVIVINNLLLGRAGTLPPVAQVPPYIDVNGDGILSPVDANQVITYLTLFGIQTGGATPLAAPQVAVVASADDTAAPADAAPAAMATSTADVADAVALPASSAVAFSLSLDTAELPAATFASSTFDVAPAPVATPVSPTAHAAYATGDDIWEAEDWDASADELDGIVADLFDDSEETDAAFA